MKLLRALESHRKGVLVRDLLAETGTTAIPLRALEEKGLVRFSEAHHRHSGGFRPRNLPTLDAPEQARAWQAIQLTLCLVQTLRGVHAPCSCWMTPHLPQAQIPGHSMCVPPVRPCANGSQALLLTPNNAAMRRIAQQLEEHLPGRVLSWHGTMRSSLRRTTWERIERGELGPGRWDTLGGHASIAESGSHIG